MGWLGLGKEGVDVIEDVFKAAIDMLDQGDKAALSTIISSKGSLPMSEKSKMLVTPEGKIIGTVGGGCLEADVWTEARRVMERLSATIDFGDVTRVLEQEGIEKFAQSFEKLLGVIVMRP